MVEKVRVGMHREVVVRRAFERAEDRAWFHPGIEKTKNGLLEPYNPVTKLKGSARNVFRETIECQRKLRKEWKTSYDLVKT